MSARRTWSRRFNESLEHDDWGHVIEAEEGYDSLARTIWTAPRDDLELEEQGLIRKLVVGLKLRVASLRGKSGLVPGDMRSLTKVFDELQKDSVSQDCFILDLAEHADEVAAIETELDTVESTGMIKNMDLDGNCTTENHGSSKMLVDGTGIALHIDKIGIKDAESAGYMQPQIKVTLVDAEGNAIEEPQETPQGCGLCVKQHVLFDHKICLRTSLEKLKDMEGCAIFFEFNHYKPDKSMVSTKCYSFMEIDEFSQTRKEVALEICRCEKPTNFRRNAQPKRLSVKDHLNFHLDVLLTR